MSSVPNRHLVISVALLATLGSTSPAFAQQPDAPAVESASADDEPLSARVEIAADTLPGDTRAEVESEVEAQLAALAAAHGLTISKSESAELLLRVELGQPNHKNPVYVVHSVALHDGRVLQRGEAQTCLRCTPAELVTEALAILPSAVERALAERPEPVEESAPAAVDTAPEPGAERGARSAGPGAAAYVGIAAGSLGLVSAITGGVLLARDDNTTPSNDPSQLTVINYRPPGVALLSVGLTSMVAGTALLAIDAWVLAPRRSAKTARVELSGVGLRF
ncbi:hypothetical protein G6O69_02840 [Pseudenhygromyxa sp. WMMC2535]|uniref:hypothetical protein n=1 Tax=Pseudenhygromyxa sp. WMMC2535 TaxID=2712867 RepID=UPI00155491F5|nr:hypothetical protein [Pseudenhygromyxa sp. WMMC2535]NVB36753.1 hypothetical protein [Pseudenhygromyxa sp. WMMC2535]